jgi:hypothetical protein
MDVILGCLDVAGGDFVQKECGSLKLDGWLSQIGVPAGTGCGQLPAIAVQAAFLH